MDEDLKKLQALTEQAMLAVDGEDIAGLTGLIAERQAQMDLIDARRAQGECFSRDSLQLLGELAETDRQLRARAEALLESYRKNLQMVRRFQKVKGYEPYTDPARHLDIRE